MTEMFAGDERVLGPAMILPLAEQLTTDPLLQRIKDDIAKKEQTGERDVGPGYESHIVQVSILDASHAQVLDCSKDQGQRLSASGQVLVRGDDFYKYRQTTLSMANGRWLVSDIYTGGSERCTPGN